MIGNIEHRMDVLSGRQIQGDERKALRNALASKLPREQYIENISTLPSEVLASGCCDACPNKNVLNQVRHEAREIETPSKDEWAALFAIRKEQQGTSGHCVKGFLQITTMHPKGIILFSEKLVRIYHNVAKHDIVYIDATGSILLGDKHCYAYKIVIRHPHPGNPPLAVAMYFAVSHNIPSVSYFISSFCHAESVFYKSNRTIPKLVMCDDSLALIQSIVLSFFKEALQVGYI